jgi:hypothetical protein
MLARGLALEYSDPSTLSGTTHEEEGEQGDTAGGSGTQKGGKSDTPKTESSRYL